MKHLKQTAALAALLITATAVPVMAAERVVPISAPLEAVPISAPLDIVPISAPIDLERLRAQTEVSATAPLPSVIQVNGKAIATDMGSPVIMDGVLRVPLRAIVEAAGGTIRWNGDEQSIEIRMPDRSVHMAIGEAKAEMNQDGVNYLVRNLIEMAAAPVLVESRTLISADALTTIFGMVQTPAGDRVMNLVPAVIEGPKAVDVQSITGAITRVEEGRILIEGTASAGDHFTPLYLFIREVTKIVKVVDGEEQPATAADLAVGVRVEADYSGPMLMSYPGQVGADVVRILGEAKPMGYGEIKGSITMVEEGRILVEGTASQGDAYSPLYLFIREETRIVIVVDGEEQVGTAADLEVGQQVEAEYSGPMLKSYPGQVGADVVRILK